MECVHPYRPAGDIAETHSADCISIQHSYHAQEGPHERVTTLDFAKALVGRWEKWLLSDQIAKVIRDGGISELKARQDPKVVEEQLGFLDRHHHRMLYSTYRSNGWFVDSRVVAVACRTVVGRRLKQCGVFWSIGGCCSVLNFRTFLLSQQFDALWKDRVASKAASNRTLAVMA